MSQGGTFSQGTQQTAQPAQQAAQPPAAPAGGFGFGPGQFGPQIPQQNTTPQTVQAGQANAPLLGGSSYGFGPEQVGPQQQNPFGMTSNTFAAQQTPFSAAPAQQPNLSTAMGQIKGGDQFAAQNTMRQIVGLPPLQAPAYNANPTLPDAQNLMKSGDTASAQAMMRQIVGLSQPAAAAPPPPPQTYMNVAPPAAAPAPAAPTSNMYSAPRNRLFGRR